jgi:RNA polymerase sigma factor (sigma-70 family)
LSFLRNISSSNTDLELLHEYKSSGDLKPLGELYQRYMELVYGVCLKYVKDTEDARDCVLNIFEELITKLKKHEVENFKSWLYQVAKNHCLMRLRSEKGKTPVKIDMAFMQSEENLHLNGELDNESNFKQLEYCLGQLTPEQRRGIELFYLEGKCYNEIVELTGMEWNKVRSYIQNGRRNLKICMDEKKLENER